MADSYSSQTPSGFILKTKLFIPQILPDTIFRESLLGKLEETEIYRLVLVSAPTGFGKTSLVSHWAHQTSMQVGWLSLDTDDNDPHRFIHYLVAALQSILPDIGRNTVDFLGNNRQLSSAIGILVNDIADTSDHVSLVLDDYHVITNSDVHNALTYLIDNAPPQLHILITSRTDPPLPLARWRTRRQLMEIRTNDLRFSDDDIRRLIHLMTQQSLADKEVAVLASRTEGWIAGLQIAALSMQDHSDAVMFIHTFSGVHHHIFDYLSQEVFDRLSDTIQAFLLQTSILSDMFGPLCDAVTGDDNSQATLDYLSTANLFVSVMDTERHCFRYHNLFADFLRNRLKDSEYDPIELHLKASYWFEENRIIEQAIHHAFQAEQFERVANLITTYADDLMWKQRSLGQMIHWISDLPKDIVRQHPKLCISIGRALFVVNQFEMIDVYLETAEASGQSTIQGETAIIRSEIALFEGKPEIALQLCHTALELINESDHKSRAIALQMEGYIYSTIGDVRNAQKSLIPARDLARQVDEAHIDIFATTDLAQVFIKQGKLQDALETYAAIIARTPAGNYPALASAYIGMGDIYREWNDLDQAHSYILQGIQDAHLGNVVNLLRHAYTLLAHISFAKGDSTEAFKSIQHAINLASIDNRDAPSVMRVNAHHAWLSLKSGDLETVRLWAENCGLAADDSIHYQREVEYAVFARILLHDKQFEAATTVTQQLIGLSQDSGRYGNLIEDLVLQACILSAQGRLGEASDSLCQALDLSAKDGYQRVFMDAGEMLIPILHKIASEGNHINIIRDILEVIEEDGTPDQQSRLIENLSDRELEVLRLVAIGLTNRQIAEQLFIGIATVKTHLIKIYGKLNVNNRVQAVTAAQDAGLL